MSTDLNRFLRHTLPFRHSDRTDQGHALPHPEEDLEDEGLQFDVVTVLSRRGAAPGADQG